MWVSQKTLPSQTQGQIPTTPSQNHSSLELLGPALLGHQSPKIWGVGSGQGLLPPVAGVKAGLGSAALDPSNGWVQGRS